LTGLRSTIDSARSVAGSWLRLWAAWRRGRLGKTVEQAAGILRKDGNGLCTTEWILASLKDNEIGLLTLGTQRSKLYRSSKNEWFGDTPGFYWSCNNTKDLEVRLETVNSLTDRPSAAAVFVPSKRDALCLRLYDQFKGKMDAEFARQLVTTPALVAAPTADAKYTTAELARELQTWATFGPPLGRTWQPTAQERQQFPEVRPLVSNPWAVLGPGAPERREAGAAVAVDLHDPSGDELPPPPKKEAEPATVAAWHGTLLPKADGDIWLTTAFANYERIVALERLRLRQARGEPLDSSDLDELGVALFYYRSLYELGARRRGCAPGENPRHVARRQVAQGRVRQGRAALAHPAWPGRRGRLRPLDGRVRSRPRRPGGDRGAVPGSRREGDRQELGGVLRPVAKPGRAAAACPGQGRVDQGGQEVDRSGHAPP
jgi:hypothetical protein